MLSKEYKYSKEDFRLSNKGVGTLIKENWVSDKEVRMWKKGMWMWNKKIWMSYKANWMSKDERWM